MDGSVIASDDVVYYAAVSADGCIATADGGVDWLSDYFIPELGFHDFIVRVGGVIMGRGTFDKIAAHGQWPYQGKPGTVASHRPLEDVGGQVSKVEGGPEAVLNAARAHGPGPYWLVGGADLAGQFLVAGALTRIDLFVTPVLLGGGIPAFRNNAIAGLELIDTQTYPKSIARLSYRPRAQA